MGRTGSNALPRTGAELAAALPDARRRTLALVADLDDDQLMGPRLDIVNPLLWEIGHVAWFQERWNRRHLRGAASLLAEADVLYDSMAVPHDTRWDLKLVGRGRILEYMEHTLDDTLKHLAAEPSDEELYFHLLALFHEDMHVEAFCYTRQTLGYGPPSLGDLAVRSEDGDVDRSGAGDDTGPREPGAEGDVEIAGGTHRLGAVPGRRSDFDPFVFDNEMWAHEVKVEPFAMARTAVTQQQFAGFVDAGGYERPELWSDEGRGWRQEVGATRPAYWSRDGEAGPWRRRIYDRSVPLQPDLPMVHVGWHEADAYCRWAGRRLPTEAEWELAASTVDKTTYPWGEESSARGRANLDGAFASASLGGMLPVTALPLGDTVSGLRQMLGNVWEWTATDFQPYPGFVAGPYKDYSAPWFGDHKVLRGGCWASRSRMMRNTLRNFYRPDRRDVWAGFRTCAP